MKPFIFIISIVRVAMVVLTIGLALYAFFAFQDINVRVMAVTIASIIVISLLVKGERG